MPNETKVNIIEARKLASDPRYLVHWRPEGLKHQGECTENCGCYAIVRDVSAES